MTDGKPHPAPAPDMRSFRNAESRPRDQRPPSPPNGAWAAPDSRKEADFPDSYESFLLRFQRP